METSIADVYRACWVQYSGSVPPEFDNLERLIRVAKLWSAVEFLGNARLKPKRYPEKTVSYIVQKLPKLPGYIV